ncbi:hypothetical protein UPYG_G00227780 [Umbra pygmaea]|uniref:Ig-like domain-containing protein n=1 Tax=Umbra pygmaea TaxID=75934 RepID=A0ABD0X0M5_UMBPY
MDPVGFLLLFLPLGAAVKQSPDLMQPEGHNATLTCSQINSTDNSMFWFYQRTGQRTGLELIVNSYVTMVTLEDGADTRRSARRDGVTLLLTLTMLKRSDSGVFYCAKQDTVLQPCLNPLQKLWWCFG